MSCPRRVLAGDASCGAVRCLKDPVVDRLLNADVAVAFGPEGDLLQAFPPGLSV
jgi:hypothetical protein